MNFDGDLRKIGDIDVARFAQHAAKITDVDWTADAFARKLMRCTSRRKPFG